MIFKDKVVLVTGGSRGIGKEISKAFAAEGANVLIVYRNNEESARQVIQELGKGRHHLMRCDIGDPVQVADLFKKIKKTAGRIDFVINNAGIGFHHPVDRADYDEWQEGWEKILRINLVGPANVCYQASQMMIQQGGGRIINITSRGAFRGEPDQPAYGASKAGLNSLTQSLAYKLSPYGIFVGAIAPGFVETDMAYERLQGESGQKIKSQSPMNRVALPEEVAQAVILMAQSNLWMTGSIFDVNGASYLRT